MIMFSLQYKIITVNISNKFIRFFSSHNQSEAVRKHRLSKNKKSCNRQNTDQNKIQIIATWTIENFFPKVDSDEVSRSFKLWTQWRKSRGDEWTIARLKFLRLSLMRYIAGEPLLADPYVKYYKKTLLPKGLPFKDGILADCTSSIRAAFTLLEWNKTINFWSKPSYSSITEDTKFDSVIIAEEIRSTVRRLKLDGSFKDIEWSEYHFSVKAGPNGSATYSALADLHALNADLISSLKVIGGTKFSENVDLLRSLVTQTSFEKLSVKKDNCSEPLIRKISIVRAPENKNRPIAIFDYWSQTVLKPIHDAAYNVLRTFKSDKTYSQRRVSMKDDHYCYDLSKATDRFPMNFQNIVMEELFCSKDKALAWERILTNFEFRTPEGQYIKYRAGQPMGAYSSWAVFSICHHIVVQMAIGRAGINKPSRSSELYALLGDDIVIFDKDVAFHYESLIKLLDVEISPEKTIKSKDFMEFAKCYFYKGNNVTPFHIHAILQTYKSFDTFCSFWSNMSIDGWDTSVVPENVVKDLYVRLGFPKRYASRQSKLITVYNDLVSYINDPVTHVVKPYVIMKSLGYNWSCNSYTTQAPKFLMEVCAVVKMRSVIEAFTRATAEISIFVKEYTDKLSSLGIEFPQGNTDIIPIVYGLVTKHRSVYSETQTFESNIGMNTDWLALYKFKGYSFLPSVTQLISLKPRRGTGDVKVKTIVQQLCNFIITESRDIDTVLKK